MEWELGAWVALRVLRIGLWMGLLFLVCPFAAWASPAGELSAWIAAEDARLGAFPGTIVIDQAGRISSPVTLHRGHNLDLRAPIEWGATVHLAGANLIQCTAKATLNSRLPPFVPPSNAGAMLLAERVSGIGIEGCAVRGVAEAVLLSGTQVSELTVRGNVLNNMQLVVTTGPPLGNRNLTISGNSMTGGPNGSRGAPIQLGNAFQVNLLDNTFNHLIHGAMWWGGDAGAPGASLQGLTAAAEMTFKGNHCKEIQGACIWGSMGRDVVIEGNTADGCGDVCFDTEGGLRTQIIDNTAVNCGNGCAGIFFFTDKTTIARNHFRADAPGGGLIFIKNSSQNPVAHDHLTIENNELTCTPAPCRAVYQEAAGGIQFVANEVTDGVWAAVGYARAVVIAKNHLVYTKALTAGQAGLMAPGIVGGTTLEVVGNRIESNTPQPGGSACIAARWTDFNAADTHLIAGNLCAGTHPFPVGLSVVSEGRNPGLAGVWILSANQLGRAPVEHVATTPNERFFDLGECGAGCRMDPAAIAGVKALPGCGGRAPAAMAGSMPVCLGPVRGWGMVLLPR